MRSDPHTCDRVVYVGMSDRGPDYDLCIRPRGHAGPCVAGEMPSRPELAKLAAMVGYTLAVVS